MFPRCTVSETVTETWRQKGFAAAGQHGSSTNRPGPGQLQVLWPITRLGLEAMSSLWQEMSQLWTREPLCQNVSNVRQTWETQKKTVPAERQRQRPVYTVTVDDFSNRAGYDVLDVHCQTNCVLNVDKSGIIVRPTENGVVLSMELDTATWSAISTIPVDVYQ